MIEYISLGSNCSVTYQLNKYGLRLHTYLFDWVKINIAQLNVILEKDFNDFVESLEFKKISHKHKYFGNLKIEEIDNIFYQYDNLIDNSINDIENSSESIILTNKYHIEFAYELSLIEQIEYFKSRMIIRINRFKNIKSNCISNCKSNQICVIRIELNPIKSIWIENIQNLIRLL